MKDYLVGVDIGGTNVRVTLASKEGIIAKYGDATRKTKHPSDFSRHVCGMIKYACEKADGVPCAIGVSSCGPFEKPRALVEIVAPNICGGLAPEKEDRAPNNWRRIHFERDMKKQYSCPLVIINDAVSSAAAERMFGALRGVDNGMYWTWSTGVGGGAIVDGRLIGGKNGNAAHVGHQRIALEKDAVCGCGSYSHLESLCAGPAVELAYRRKTGQSVRVLEVFQRYESDDAAREVIKDAAKAFAIGLANAATFYDSDVMVIGGSMWKDKEILRPLVMREFYAQFPPLTKGVEIRDTALGEYVGDVAALSLVLPAEWVRLWRKKQPWKSAPDVVKLNA